VPLVLPVDFREPADSLRWSVAMAQRINYREVANWLEVVSKPPLRPNNGVESIDLILEILNVLLRLNPPSRLDLEPD
jgi:hypothetical protein